MKITTTVCDLCYSIGQRNLDDILHNCGELGDFCDYHFKELQSIIQGKSEPVVKKVIDRVKEEADNHLWSVDGTTEDGDPITLDFKIEESTNPASAAEEKRKANLKELLARL